jgi:hypothetical protein
VKKTKTLGYGMIQPPMRSWFRYKIQGTADLCTEIMAKKVEVPGAFPMCPAENHRSHLFGGPLPGEPALSWHTKEADNKSSCSGLMVTSKKIDLFFYIDSPICFQKWRLKLFDIFLGPSKTSTVLAVTWCPWFSRQRSAPRGCSL